MVQRMFQRTIGIDYSGSDTPLKRLSGLRVFKSDGNDPPREVRSRAHPKGQWNWNRKEIAEWLVEQLQKQDKPTLVGIDHAFSFPIEYFQKYNNLIGPSWHYFLVDFRKYWPTHEDGNLVRKIKRGTGQCRSGESTWRRLTDHCSGTAKSVFHFNVQGSVAHSTYAGIPWLRYVRKELGDGVHFWPFDGWDIEKGKSVIAEVYPSIWRGRFRRADSMNDHQHDAYSIAGWLSRADRNGWLADYLNPNLSQAERDRASTEGWILGVPGFIDLDQE